MFGQARCSSASRLGWLAVITVFAASAAMMSAFAQSASATSLLACDGSLRLSFSPGLTNEEQKEEVTDHYNYSSCINDENLFEGRTGTIERKFTAELSCKDLLTVLTGEGTIRWSNGNDSVVDVTNITTATPVLGQVEAEGTVTGGEFDKSTIAGTDTFLESDLEACSQPGGGKEISGLAVLAITL